MRGFIPCVASPRPPPARLTRLPHQELDLKRPIYSKTASFGHFGRNDPDFTWETPKKLVY